MKKFLSLMLVLAMVMTGAGMTTLAGAPSSYQYQLEQERKAKEAEEAAKKAAEEAVKNAVEETEAEEVLAEVDEVLKGTEAEVEAAEETANLDVEAETELDSEVETTTEAVIEKGEAELETEVETETEAEDKITDESKVETETVIDINNEILIENDTNIATISEIDVDIETNVENSKELICYIKDVKTVVASKEDAEKIFTDNGYTMIPTNLNDGATGKEIYVGYTTTNDENEAVTAIGERWFNASGRNPQSYVGDYHKYNFTAVSDFNGKQWNTNEGGNKDTRWVYLYTSKDKEAGKPIANIEVLSQNEAATIEELVKDDSWTVVTNSNNGELADFNRSNAKNVNHIYIRYSTIDNNNVRDDIDEFNRSKIVDLNEIYSDYNSYFSINNNIIKLEKDLQLNKPLNIINVSVVLDLNGHSLTSSNDSYAVYLDNATFSLIDSTFEKDEVKENTSYENMYKGRIIGKYDEAVIFMKESDVFLNQGYINKTVNIDSQNSVILIEKSNLTIDGAIIKGSNGKSYFNKIGDNGGIAIKINDSKKDNTITFKSGLVYGGNGGNGSDSNVEANGGYGFMFGNKIIAIDKLGYNFGKGINGGYGGGNGGAALFLSDSTMEFPIVELKEKFAIIGGDGGKGQTKIEAKNKINPYLAFSKNNANDIDEEIDDDELPTKYDARDEGIVTSLKWQTNLGWCWNFANCSVAETYMLKHYKDYTDKYLYNGEFDLSEESQGYFIINHQKDPLGNAGESYEDLYHYLVRKDENGNVLYDENNQLIYDDVEYKFYSDDHAGRNQYHILNYQSAFRGHTTEEISPFYGHMENQPDSLDDFKGARENNVINLKKAIVNDNAYTHKKVVMGDDGKYYYVGRDEFVNEVKKDLLKYGSLEMFVNWTKSYYCGTDYGVVFPSVKYNSFINKYTFNDMIEHAITIVGWDDNFNSWNIDMDVDRENSGSGGVEDGEALDMLTQLNYLQFNKNIKFCNNKGAFLCKNSNSRGNYVWVSYDMPFYYVAFEYVPADKYNDIYYYDGGISLQSTSAYNMDVQFDMKKEDLLQGTTIIVHNNAVNVEYNIFKNGINVISDITDLHEGLNYIDLSMHDITVKKGDKIKIEFNSNNSINFGIDLCELSYSIYDEDHSVDHPFRQVTTIHESNKSKGYNPRIKLITGDNVTVKFDTANGVSLEKDTYTISKYERIKMPQITSNNSKLKFKGWYNKDNNEMVDDNTRFTEDTVLCAAYEYNGNKDIIVTSDLLFKKLGSIKNSIKKICFTDTIPSQGKKYEIEDGLTAYVNNDTAVYVIEYYRELVLPDDSSNILNVLSNYVIEGFDKINVNKTNTKSTITYTFKANAKWASGYTAATTKALKDKITLDSNKVVLADEDHMFLGFKVKAVSGTTVLKDLGYLTEIPAYLPYLNYSVTVDVRDSITLSKTIILTYLPGFNTSDKSQRVKKITFTKTAPKNATLLENLDNSLYIYENSSTYEAIYYLKQGKLKAPEDCQNLFSNLSRVTEIKGLDIIDWSDVTSMYKMFENCSSLTNIDLTSINSKNITNMARMFDGCSNLKSVDLSSIELVNTDVLVSYMFRNCTKLTTIYANTWDATKIGSTNYAFYGCKSLVGVSGKSASYKELSFAKTDFSVGEIGLFSNKNAIYYKGTVTLNKFIDNLGVAKAKITSLEFIKNTEIVDNENKIKLTNGVYAVVYGTDVKIYISTATTVKLPASCKDYFGNMTNLKTLTGLAYLDTSDVTSMYDMFHEDKNLTTLDVSSFKTSKVTTFAFMFNNCINLTEIKGLDNFNTSNATSMKAMFQYNYKLQSADLSNFDTAKVVDYSFMFRGCKSMAEVKTSEKFVSTSAQYMSSMFNMCNVLTTIDLSNFELKKSNIPVDYMFCGCYKLTTIYAKSWDATKIGKTNYTFNGCNSLIGIAGKKASYNAKSFSKTDFSVGESGLFNSKNAIYYKGTVTLNKFIDNLGVAKAKITSLEFIKNTEVVDNENKIKLTDGVYAVVNGTDVKIYISTATTVKLPASCKDYFGNMTNLKTLTGLAYLDTSDVTSMYDMFHEDKNLTTLDVSSFKTSKVTTFAFMFNNCINLTEIKGLDNFNTSNATSMKAMFQYNYKLQSADLSNFDTAKVVDYSFMFRGCKLMAEVKTSEKFVSTSAQYMSSMFNMCNVLTTIDLSNFELKKSNIPVDYMFCGCYKLTTIYAKSWDATKIGKTNYTFNGCNSLIGIAGKKASYNAKSFAKTDFSVGKNGLFTYETNIYNEGTVYLPSITVGLSMTEEKFTSLEFIKSDIALGDKLIKLTEGIYAFVDGTDVKVYISTQTTPKLIHQAGSYFSWMTNLKTLSGLKYIDTSEVTSMSCMFYNCRSLTTLDLTGFNTSNVTDMSHMFDGSFNLTEIKGLKSFDTSNVTNMSGMFMYNENLESLDLSWFKIKQSNVDVHKMFYYCTKLKTIYVAASWDTSKLGNMVLAFSGCTVLKGQYGKTASDETIKGNFTINKDGLFTFIGTIKGTYIEDIKMLVADAKTADAIFKTKGYTMIAQNLNGGTKGKEIYIGYTTTDDKSKAITSIGERWFNAANRNPLSYTGSYHKYNYTAVTDFNGKQWNTNEGGNSDARWVYLYTSKDTKAGDPINEIEVIQQTKASSINELSGGSCVVVTNSNDNSLSDFNRSNNSNVEHIYIRYIRRIDTRWFLR